MPESTRVFFDHDGGIDDFLALLLLLTYEVELLGISITPADTYIEAAQQVTRKILDLAGRKAPVAAGTLEGPNPFPDLFRADSLKINALPILNSRPHPQAPLSELAGHELMTEILTEEAQPVTLVMTGPLTNLAWCLDHHPDIESKVDELYLMGGALDVTGNVEEPGHDGSAEWNIYWDPPAAARVWESSIRIRLFPLDVTNQVPVTDNFRLAFGPQRRYPFSEAAGAFWAITAGYDYYCWDTLTVAALAHPGLCTYREVRCAIVSDGESQGRTEPRPDGRAVTAADQVDAEAFYAHCLETLRYPREPLPRGGRPQAGQGGSGGHGGPQPAEAGEARSSRRTPRESGGSGSHGGPETAEAGEAPSSRRTP